MFLKILSLQRKKLAITLGCSLGAGALFLLVVQCVMMFHPDPQSTPIIVRWIVCGAGAVALFVMTMIDGCTFLPMSIRMGATRKKMLPILFGIHLIVAVVIYLAAMAMTQLEWFLTQNVWMHMVAGLIIENVSSDIVWWATIVMLLGGMLAGYFISAVFARFGNKIGGYVMCGLWLSFIALQNGMVFGEISPLDYLPPVARIIGLVAVILWIIHSLLTMSVGSE